MRVPMSEPVKNPFDLLLEQFREIVRAEMKAAGTGNEHTRLLTAEQLAQALQVNKATVYLWVKSNAIPYYQAGRFIRFNLHEVLESQRNRNQNPA